MQKEYEKQFFVDGEVLFANQLNTIEKGIVQNEKEIQEIWDHLKDLNLDLPQATDDLLSYQGEISLKELNELKVAKNGNIYRLIDTDENISEFNKIFELNFKNREFIVCIKSFDLSRMKFLPPTYNFKEHWANKYSLGESADYDTPGIVDTVYQEFSGEKRLLDGLIVQSHLALNDAILYVNGSPAHIPSQEEMDKIYNQLQYANNLMEDISFLIEDLKKRVEIIESTYKTESIPLAFIDSLFV